MPVPFASPLIRLSTSGGMISPVRSFRYKTSSAAMGPAIVIIVMSVRMIRTFCISFRCSRLIVCLFFLRVVEVAVFWEVTLKKETIGSAV